MSAISGIYSNNSVVLCGIHHNPKDMYKKLKRNRKKIERKERKQAQQQKDFEPKIVLRKKINP